jgi:hypothetical protein
MLKALKVTALVCGLLIIRGQHAHTLRQLVRAATSVPWNSVTEDRMPSIETHTKPINTAAIGGTVPPCATEIA